MTLRDSLAKALWTGDVEDRADQYDVGNLTDVRKAEGRKGTVPSQVATPVQGKPRPFNATNLRKLADTETVQSAIDTLVAEVKTIDSNNLPEDPERDDMPILEEIDDALQDLNPNKESKEDVEEMWLRDLLEVGNAVAVKNFNIDGRRVEVNPLDPVTFVPDWDSNRILQGFYQYDMAGMGFWDRPDFFEPEELIWLTINPETTRAGFYGHSPTEKLQRVINVLGGLLEKETKELEEGMPPGLVSLVGDWSDSDYKKFETYWQNNVKGEQHKVPLAKGEAKFEPFTMSYQELQILDRQQWYSKLVGAIFKTPISETGLAIGEEMTRATDVSQRQKFKQKGVRPLLDLLEDAWTQQFIHPHWTEEVHHKFTPGLDLMEKRELSQIHSTLLRQGVLTVNEVREEYGKDPVEWGDRPFDLKTYQRNTGGGLADAFGLPGSDGPDDDTDGSAPTTEGQNQDALHEGLTPNEGEPTTESAESKQSSQSTNFRNGSLFPLSKAEEPLRETDNFQSFNFQPGEIEQFRQDIADLIESYTDDVIARIQENKDNWTGESNRPGHGEVQKSLPDFFQYVRDEIGLSFSQDLAAVLTEWKREKVTDGEEQILTELETAGVAVDTLDLSGLRDRVTERIAQRSLQITKPVSDRLEEELREVLSQGWTEGKSIQEIELDIEDLTDNWQGTDAERLARDQMGKASKEGRLAYATETHEEVGGWDKIWIATGDHRTRESHGAMDETREHLEDPFVVDYSLDGGPSRVEEMYPGQSRWGIQCRCDYHLVPRQTVETAKAWGERDTDKQLEIAKAEDRPVWEALLATEIRVQKGDLSRNQAWKELGLGSKRTYYNWVKEAGLYENLAVL